MTSRVFVIAEAGVNHNGDLSLAKRLVDIAADAGADAVKFQTFRATELVGRSAPKAAYQKRNAGGEESSFQMIRRLELGVAEHEALIEHCARRNIRFLSTPFDLPSLELLTQRLDLSTIKVGSGEITNAPFLVAIARAAQRVILSTGMSTLTEVQNALEALAYGFTTPAPAMPRNGDLERAFSSTEGRRSLEARVAILHCTTEYPAPVEEVNLRAMDTLATAFGLPIGYSDHTQGIHISLAAVARGARVIEKHFTTDRSLPGPDHAASLEPDELRQLVRGIRDIESAMGDGTKAPTDSERGNIVVARKSIVAARPIATGETFTTENITCKRPGNGMSPFEYWGLLRRRAKRAYAEDEAIDD